MRISKSEVHLLLLEVIKRDINDGLLKRLTERSCIYDMCSNIIEHDKTYLWQHVRRFADILNLIPEQRQDLKICDIGAGVGFLSILLKTKYGYQVEAVDLRESVSFWKERFEKYGITQYAVDITKETLPFQNESFDVVIFSEVIEHLPSPQSPLVEIKRVLKSNGYLILTTPNICRFSNIVSLISGRNILPKTSATSLLTSTPKTPHMREYTLDELRVLTKDVGLRIDRVYMSRCWDKRLAISSNLSLKKNILIHLCFHILNSVVTICLPRFRSCIMIRAIK